VVGVVGQPPETKPEQVSPHRIRQKNFVPKKLTITDWWFGTFFIFHNIWDVILPID